MRTLIVIPARYASTRFPGKPLALLGGKPVIQWVWDSVSGMPGCDAIVATDDERIRDAVEAFGGHAMMTSDKHRSGTDRCGEVAAALAEQGREYDIVVNLQGDEPFTRRQQVAALLDCFGEPQTSIATLRTPIRTTEELLSPNNVKVVCDAAGHALYFSRQPLPYLRGVRQEEWTGHHEYYKHVGIYAFHAGTLAELVRLKATPLECGESLEQLRWLENGYAIQTRLTDSANIGIDTPEDLEAAERRIQQHID